MIKDPHYELPFMNYEELTRERRAKGWQTTTPWTVPFGLYYGRDIWELPESTQRWMWGQPWVHEIYKNLGTWLEHKYGRRGK